MSLLDTLLQIFAYSIVVVPVAVLVIGVFLFFYKPAYRLIAGSILIALGSLALLVFSFSFYISLMRGQGVVFFLALLIVEAMTITTGIFSIVMRSGKKP